MNADDIIRAAHLCAMNAAICGDGTTGGTLSPQQRRDIFWRVLARELAKAKAAEKAEEAQA